MLKVKICGITNLKDALLAETLGADLLGFVFYPGSPRHVSVSTVSQIISKLSPLTRKVGVFVNEKPEKILKTAQKLKLDFVQLAGDESLAEVSKIQMIIPAIKVFRIAPGFKPSVLRRSPAALRLADSKAGGFYGGSGKSFDWKMLSGLRGDARLMLAGGIGPDNLAEAHEILRPAAVDLTSSVESRPGKKDPDKLKRFFEVANEVRHGR
jgi:phosphoribosylanthranilate isomerase